MKKATIPLVKEKILIISDAHFKNDWENISPFCNLLDSLTAKNYHLILLGDLFHIWFNIPSFLSKEQKKLLQFLEQFRKKGAQISFLVGNRDIFFRQNTDFLPFDFISSNSLIFETSNKKKILFEHGDLINKADKSYFIWRRFIRSNLVKNLFLLMPVNSLNKLAQFTERALKKNKKHKINFPHKYWIQFLEKNSDCSLCVVGHFHPKKNIIHKQGKTTGIVLEDWMDRQVYHFIDQELNLTTKYIV